MKLFVTLLTFGFSLFSHAAELNGKEVLCNYTFKTVSVGPGNTRAVPMLQNGQVKLSLNGLSYGPAEVKFSDFFKAIITASIATDMILEMKIKTEAPNSQILGQATSFHRDNEIGVYQGRLEILSSEISSLADQENISFDAASTSEKLSPGLHFVGASINCF